LMPARFAPAGGYDAGPIRGWRRVRVGTPLRIGVPSSRKARQVRPSRACQVCLQGARD